MADPRLADPPWLADPPPTTTPWDYHVMGGGGARPFR